MLPGKGDVGNADNSELDSGIKKMFFVFYRAWEKETICKQEFPDCEARLGWTQGLKSFICCSG